MKLVTFVIICPMGTPSDPIKQKIGEVLGLTMEDPQFRNDYQKRSKILYWKDIELSDNYDLFCLITQLVSTFPSFTIFDITRPAPTFREKHGTMVGVLGGLAGLFFGLWGFIASLNT